MAKIKRPKMTTKEELIKYLEANKNIELPFNEVVWNIAVEKTKDKERQNKILTETDFDGTTKKKVIPNGSVNPVGKYLQMMALPQYQKPYVDPNTEPEEEENEEFEFKFEDEEKNEAITNWLNVFFNGYSKEDKKFLHERLSDYYDNYELNEGADKTLVIMTVTDELQIMKLTQKRIKGTDVEAQLKNLKKSFLEGLEGLKALKKQRGNADEGKNKLTQWIDELEKAGEFRPKHVDYPADEVDFMIKEFTKSIVEVFRNG